MEINVEENREKKRPYFKTSTASQRKYLFEKWEETGSVTKACQAAKLSRTAFYLWKPRFDKESYAGLEKQLSHAPHNPRKTSKEVREKVIAMKKAHPEWGRQRIADELMKNNNWEQVVGSSTVRRILLASGLMKPKAKKRKKK